MSKVFRQQGIKPFAIILLGIGLIYIVVEGFVQLHYRKGDYLKRFCECNPKELLQELEKASNINFPRDIRNIKAAKSPPIDGDVLFILRFESSSNVFTDFLESFPKEPLKVNLEPYVHKYDRRRSAGFWTTPSWFTELIQKGEECIVILCNRKAEIYVDTTNNESFIVYIKGSYPVS